ncbi:conserved protein, unknown function, partial [Hepatocystis sp. ex Piliocolobus tephrosceles]
MKNPLQMDNLNKFSLSEENIIAKFENSQNDLLLDKTSHQTSIKQKDMNIDKTNVSHESSFHHTHDKNQDTAVEDDTLTHKYPLKNLLHKIMSLENEKKKLLKFLENKNNTELEYKKALQTQAAVAKSENKKSEFYENEWLHMKSIEYSCMNNKKEQFRKTLELLYKDPKICEKLGNLTESQKLCITNVLKDQNKLVKELNTTSKKYQEAV